MAVKKSSKKSKQKLPLIGWREWVTLPGLGLPAVKAKIDTGARTSSLHAYHIEPFKLKGANWVRFCVHPVQRRNDIVEVCEAEVVDRRHVTDSGGHKELRYVVATPLRMGKDEWRIELTLTNRDPMQFRMLLGRQALRGHLMIDPKRSFLMRKLSAVDIIKLYES